MNISDIIGQFLGILCCVIIYLMIKYADDFSDGNIK